MTITLNVDIDAAEAFRALCRALNMDFVLDEDTKYFCYNDNVYSNGWDLIDEDRSELFLALRQVSELIIPNVAFRGENYDPPTFTDEEGRLF